GEPRRLCECGLFARTVDTCLATGSGVGPNLAASQIHQPDMMRSCHRYEEGVVYQLQIPWRVESNRWADTQLVKFRGLLACAGNRHHLFQLEIYSPYQMILGVGYI